MSKDRVLVVDDNPDVRDILKFHLEREFDVRVAADGRAAVEEAERWQPDIVVLDVLLPVLNGFEVLEELKRRGVATRVLMCSGRFTGVDDVIRGIRAGACDYLIKPLWPPELVDRLKRYVLLESTINLRVSELAPLVETLIGETESLTKELHEARAECVKLRRQRRRLDILTKGAYVSIALAATYLFQRMGAPLESLIIGAFFIALVALLFIPIERLQAVSAELAKFKTRISLKG